LRHRLTLLFCNALKIGKDCNNFAKVIISKLNNWVFDLQIIKNTKDLLASGLIDKNQIAQINEIAQQHTIAISGELVGSMAEKSQKDPIYRQYVPSLEENKTFDFELLDPIGDDIHSKVFGLVHRYQSRALLKLTNSCAVYCRFCFRRESVGRENAHILNDSQVQDIVNYLQEHKEINEIILSGGDSLAIGKKRLAKILSALAKIEHIKILRIHTRVPMAMPQLIDDELLQIIKNFGRPVFVVLHINHANEFSENVKTSIRNMRENGFSLLSQSVLLQGVNDNAQTLANLANAILENGIKPYYLHHPDFARGTAHFALNLEEGMKIYNEFKKKVSGLGFMRYVLDIPKGFGKIDLNSDNVRILENGHYEVKDRNDQFHKYPNIRL
jgi:lysine 2,3-aminomutase